MAEEEVGMPAVEYDVDLLNIAIKVQRTFLHDRLAPGEYDVLENLFSEHLGNGLISASGKLILGALRQLWWCLLPSAH